MYLGILSKTRATEKNKKKNEVQCSCFWTLLIYSFTDYRFYSSGI